jgi:biopolymer transport protein ExbB
MLANIIVDYFINGGPIMYPILLVALVGVAVIGERIFWWWRESLKRDPKTLERVLAALEHGDVDQARELSKGSPDPVIRVIWHGLNHHDTSLEGALQVAAGAELQRAGRFLTVMDTLVTLAPLLGLLGTVTGIMRAFNQVPGSPDPEKVMGGIGEALIATMCGLGIAIVSLVPFNFFTNKTAKLQFELESAATNVDVMVKRAKTRAREEREEQPTV